MTTYAPPVPYQTKLHTVDFDGTYRQVEFVEENIAPGAKVPTWIVREWQGGGYRKSRVATDYYCRSKSDAYARYIEELQTGLKSITQQIKDLEAQQKEATYRLALAQDMHKAIVKEEQERMDAMVSRAINTGCRQ